MRASGKKSDPYYFTVAAKNKAGSNAQAQYCRNGRNGKE